MIWRAAQGAEKASSIHKQGRGGAMPERTIQHCFYFSRHIGHVTFSSETSLFFCKKFFFLHAFMARGLLDDRHRAARRPAEFFGKNVRKQMDSTKIKSFTRRDFLYRAAAVGGTGLLMNTMSAWGMGMESSVDGPPALTGSGKGKKILILGAGLAGMTAAFELGKLGYQCQIIEAR